MNTFGKVLGIRKTNWADLVNDLYSLMEVISGDYNLTGIMELSINRTLKVGAEMVHDLVIQEGWGDIRQSYPVTMAKVDELIDYWNSRFDEEGEAKPLDDFGPFLKLKLDTKRRLAELEHFRLQRQYFAERAPV